MRRREPQAPGSEPSTEAPPARESRLRRFKRKAGCILGLFTEPLVLLGVTLLAVVFGRAYLSRRAERLRARHWEGRQDD